MREVALEREHLAGQGGTQKLKSCCPCVQEKEEVAEIKDDIRDLLSAACSYLYSHPGTQVWIAAQNVFELTYNQLEAKYMDRDKSEPEADHQEPAP